MSTFNDDFETPKNRKKRILDELDSQALLVLLNIVNYKAGWVEKFDKNKTLIEDFTLDNGKKQSLPMMHQKGYSRFDKCERG